MEEHSKHITLTLEQAARQAVDMPLVAAQAVVGNHLVEVGTLDTEYHSQVEDCMQEMHRLEQLRHKSTPEQRLLQSFHRLKMVVRQGLHQMQEVVRHKLVVVCRKEQFVHHKLKSMRCMPSAHILALHKQNLDRHKRMGPLQGILLRSHKVNVQNHHILQIARNPFHILQSLHSPFQHLQSLHQNRRNSCRSQCSPFQSHHSSFQGHHSPSHNRHSPYQSHRSPFQSHRSPFQSHRSLRNNPYHHNPSPSQFHRNLHILPLPGLHWWIQLHLHSAPQAQNCLKMGLDPFPWSCRGTRCCC